MSETSWRGRRAAFVALVGGSVVALGALLPWMSLFAGLYRYSGIHGLYGRLTFGGGLLAAAGGVMMFVRAERFIRPLVGGVGVALTAFASWILFGLRATTHHLEAHPMLVARPEAGLFVVVAGALMLAALALPRFRRFDE